MLHAKFKRRHRIPFSLAAAIIAASALGSGSSDSGSVSDCSDTTVSCVASQNPVHEIKDSVGAS